MSTKILSTKNKNGQQTFCRQKKINVDKKFVDKKIKLSTKNLSTKKNNCRQKIRRQKNKNVDKIELLSTKISKIKDLAITSFLSTGFTIFSSLFST